MGPSIASGNPPTSTRTRIAIVDGDRRFLQVLDRAHLEGFEVELESTIEAILDRRFDVLVIDAGLPGGRWVETCRALRASCSPMTLVITSAEVTSELACAALDAGADYTLRKPFDLSTLVDLVWPLRAGASQTRLDRAKLIAEHVKLARNIARRLARRYSSILAAEDITALGMLGLCEAASSYDATRCVPFVAFATQRIRGAVLDELRRLSPQSRHGYERKRNVDAARREITRAGEDPTDGRVAAQLDIPEALVREASEPYTRVPASEIASVPSVEDSPATSVERAQALAHLASARRVLGPLESIVITMRYDDGLSLTMISESLDLSTARVMRILEQGLARMRDAFDSG